jgi:hypothetical protein
MGSLATISVRVLCTTRPEMLFNIARLIAGVQPVFSLSLEVGEYSTMSLGVDVLEGIFFVNPPFGNFLLEPKNGDKPSCLNFLGC